MATDFFLKLDKIKGESTQDGHVDEIDVMSLSYGVHAPAQIGSGGKGVSGGKASFSDISFVKNTDKSSPALLKATGSGQPIGSAIFTGQKSTGKARLVYFKITLTDTLVTSYQCSGSSGDSILTESLSFGFSKIQFDYTAQDEKGAAAGTNTGGYDLTTGNAF